MRRLLLAVTLLAAACSTGPTDNVQLSPAVPPDHKQKILTTASTVFDDPTNVREAMISDPFQVPTGSGTREGLCVRANSRDSLTRQYLGVRDYVVYFFDGQINQFVRAEAGQCAKAAYKPFPELEQICRGNKCL